MQNQIGCTDTGVEDRRVSFCGQDVVWTLAVCQEVKKRPAFFILEVHDPKIEETGAINLNMKQEFLVKILLNSNRFNLSCCRVKPNSNEPRCQTR